MSPIYLITGATGGLGSGVLHHLVTTNNAPRSDIIASSSRKEAAAQFEQIGVPFRHVDYNDLESLHAAFAGVDKLFFVSSNTYDNEARSKQHQNVIKAARETGVGHVYYTSLAWGGYSNDSKIDVQQAHLVTETMLKESGIAYTSIREGIYAEAFPLFLNYYPSSTVLRLPADGRVAFASRSELAEANARLMTLPNTPSSNSPDPSIALLTGPRALTLQEIVQAINAVTGRDICIERVPSDQYVTMSATDDEGGKPAAFFEKRVSWYEGVAKGDGATVDDLMSGLLGRRARDGAEVVAELVKADPGYVWHQNHVDGKRS